MQLYISTFLIVKKNGNYLYWLVNEKKPLPSKMFTLFTTRKMSSVCQSSEITCFTLNQRIIMYAFGT